MSRYADVSKLVDGGPAFAHGDHMNGGHPGMSLRDWFAGQVLGAIAWQCLDAARVENKTPHDAAEIAAAMADEMADAMLAARERRS